MKYLTGIALFCLSDKSPLLINRRAAEAAARAVRRFSYYPMPLEVTLTMGETLLLLLDGTERPAPLAGLPPVAEEAGGSLCWSLST